jgi:hypothetical protein
VNTPLKSSVELDDLKKKRDIQNERTTNAQQNFTCYAWKKYLRIPNHSIMGGYEPVPLH